MKKLSQLLAVSLLVSGLLLPVSAKEQIATSTGWTIDPAHSSARFAIKHMMVSNVNGSFGKVTGNVQYDGKNLPAANVDAVIDVASINTNEPKRDEHLKGKDFFDVEKYPTITFKSKKITTTEDGFKILGTLTMHGVSKDITLNSEAMGPVVNAHGKTRTGTSASAKINRKDFGISYNQALDNGGAIVGDDVKVTLDVELVQAAPKPEG
ncbi:MAG: YceI family protein [Candidatus Obscuribacterales bacterium]|nr:YceI family protein [Candidatus Obscuribacterales bacterium]